MLAMARVNCITTLREHEGKSISEIARIMDINWRTAKKYGDGEGIQLGKRRRSRRTRPVIGPYAEIVDAWLEEDLLKPAKHRRTAKVIYRDLKALGYTGSERTVRAYVKESKERLRAERAEKYVRLEHPPGHAQVDFGRAKVIERHPEAAVTERPYLVISFPYSGAYFDCLLPAENAECLLHGLTTLFGQAGGVPERLLFDNLPPAVKKVLNGGERETTAIFAEFQRHYRFEAAFCNRGRGHEKGSVEHRVGYARRNDMTPMLLLDNLDEMNRHLAQKAEQDRDRPHYEKGKKIAELWAEEQKCLLPPPIEEYEPVRTTTAVVNQVGEITLDKERYHVPAAAPRQRVFVKVFWDRLEVFDAYGETKLGQSPRVYTFKADKVDWKAELAIFRRKPRAIEHATYLKALPQIPRQFLLDAPFAERRRRVETLIALFEDYSLATIEEAIRTGLRYGSTDLGGLKAIAGYKAAVADKPKPLPEPYTPRAIEGWRPDLEPYNTLLRGVAGHGR